MSIIVSMLSGVYWLNMIRSLILADIQYSHFLTSADHQWRTLWTAPRNSHPRWTYQTRCQWRVFDVSRLPSVPPVTLYPPIGSFLQDILFAWSASRWLEGSRTLGSPSGDCGWSYLLDLDLFRFSWKSRCLCEWMTTLNILVSFPCFLFRWELPGTPIRTIMRMAYAFIQVTSRYEWAFLVRLA